MSESEDNSLLVQTVDGNESNDGSLLNKCTVKTKKLYKRSYTNFTEWRKKENMSSSSENVLLAYFQDMKKKYSPSTLSTEFSMLKATLHINEEIDISKYSELKAFLKENLYGYEAKKSKIFSPSEIKSFIEKAPDKLYLLLKVAVIFGIMGACRRHELYNLKCEDVIDTQNTLVVNIMRANKLDRIFIISGEYYNVCKKYMNLRPKPDDNPSFFIRYLNGKCVNQHIGINTFGAMGKLVAKAMKLPNPELYTGHCFRRSSVNLCDDRDNLLNKRGRQMAVAEQWNETNSRTTRSLEIEDNNSSAAEKLRIIVLEAPGPSEIIHVNALDPNVSANKRLHPLLKGSQRCRFCSRYSEEYVSISPDYLAADKTTLVFNNIKVQLDYTDNFPNVVCKNCDIKLQIMYDFVKGVKAAQESLINVEREIEARREDIGIEMVMVKTEYEDNYENDSPDEDYNDSDNDTKKGILDSLTVGETNFITESVTQKRKNTISAENSKKAKVADEDDNDKNCNSPDGDDDDSDNDTKEGILDSLTVSESKLVTQKRKNTISAETPKKAKVGENEYTEFITDIKVEVVDRDGTNDANNTAFSDSDREMPGIDVKKNLLSALIHKMRSDENS